MPEKSRDTAPGGLRRRSCLRCRRPLTACYCSQLRPFSSDPRFVILIHPREARHAFGTGRMAHLCLTNSSLFEGFNFSEDAELQAVLNCPETFPVLLYPGPASINLSRLSPAARISLVPARKKLVVVVPDATWRNSRKIVSRSRNLHGLPRITFDAPAESMYRIRRQPRPGFYSTIEAIHRVIALFTFENSAGASEPHQNLLEVFKSAIDRQLQYTATAPKPDARD